MIPELAHLAAVVGLVCAVCLGVGGYWGAARNRPLLVNSCVPIALMQFIGLLASFVLLAFSFSTDDFSVLYVAENSNSVLPWYYKISAVWGAHEGSFLLWTLVMAAWTVSVALTGTQLSQDMRGYVLGTMGWINTGFLLFLLVASNPFERLVPNVPENGADLNVILQDFGLIVHPPLLYIGYVGFSVAFAFAIGALLTGRVDGAWARWARPWTNLAWAFLTIGIALGSWWAYYELGWGGWWMWDPVENASFMPWLMGTALVHSLAVTEKRGVFKSWTVLLALMTFTLCLMGAFLVRSGVLTSVHAFAIDPERGLFLLVILIVVGAGALSLFGLRGAILRGRANYSGVSRELLLLINNAVLVLSVVTILLFTLYPLFHEWVTGGERMSIGSPYFNRVFIPLMFVLAFFLSIAPFTRWKRTSVAQLKKASTGLVIAFAIASLVALVLLSEFSFQVWLAILLACWILGNHAYEIYRQRRSLKLAFLGMACAHIGFAIAIIGVAVTSVYSESTDARVNVGDVVEVAGEQYHLTNIEVVKGPNYSSHRGTVVVGGKKLFPERRQYETRGGTITTEAGLDPGFLRDRFVSLGEPLPDGTWGIRVQNKPLVRWIWLGAIFIALGGILAILDARYRRLASRDLLEPAHAGIA